MAYFSSSLPCQPPCSGKFACLRSRLGLATRKGSTVEVARARCHYCSSKLCLSFGPFEHKDLYSKGGACATITIWDSHQLARSKMVLSRDGVGQKRWSCAVAGGHHCWFDIARPIAYFPISTSSKFACLASRPNAIGKGAMVPQLFFQAVLAIWHMWNQISTANATLPEL